jgi:hypothetical protein
VVPNTWQIAGRGQRCLAHGALPTFRWRDTLGADAFERHPRKRATRMPVSPSNPGRPTATNEDFPDSTTNGRNYECRFLPMRGMS